MNNSLESWVNSSGHRYYPDRISTLWRRSAEVTPEEAATWLGPAVERGEPPEHWAELHRHLAGVARTWRPGAFDDPTTNLVVRDVEMYLNPPGFAPRPIVELRHYLTHLVSAGEFDARLAPDGLGVDAVCLTLRAYLTAQAAFDIKTSARHHRCAWCGGWHAVFRAGGKFCSATCRSEARLGGIDVEDEASTFLASGENDHGKRQTSESPGRLVTAVARARSPRRGSRSA